MNPSDDQNPNPNQQTPVPSPYQGPPQTVQPQVPYPQAPSQPAGVIGPQFSPAGVGQNLPAGGPTKKSKIWLIVVLVVSALLLIGGVVVAVMILTKEEKQPPLTFTLTKSYDSPAGLLGSFQSQDVAKGAFKINARYVTDGDFSREGNFFVEETRTHFEVLPDAAKVNQLFKTIYSRDGLIFAEKTHGATRNQTYDFNSLLGYQYLYDKDASGYGALVSAVETVKASPKLAPKYKAVRLDETCQAALVDVQAKTGKNLTTTSMGFDFEREGVHKTRALIKFETRQALDKSVYSFLDGCFDLKHKDVAQYELVANRLKSNVTKSPAFLYWNEEGVDYLNITPADKDAPFGGEMKFEFTKLNQTTATRSGDSLPFNERRSLFGLAYSLCRVPPVVIGPVGSSYTFIVEDDAYHRPITADTGYYCTTLAVPPQYLSPESMKVKFSGAQILVGMAEVGNQRVLHDALHKIEKFKLDKNRYPGSNEFNDIANSNMEALTAASQGLVSGRLMVYAPSPAGCIGSCNDFVLNYVSGANLIHSRNSYKP